MSDWLKREQVVAALKDAQMAPPYQDRGIMAKDAVKLFRMALAALDAHADHAAEVARLEAELNELKEAISWEGRDPHLAAWRKECFDRDQSASVLDSDIVSLIDRAGKARAERDEALERVRVLEEALDNAKHALADARCQLTGMAKDEASMAIASAEAALAKPQPCKTCQTCGGKGYETHALGWMPCPDCKPQQKEGSDD